MYEDIQRFSRPFQTITPPNPGGGMANCDSVPTGTSHSYTLHRHCQPTMIDGRWYQFLSYMKMKIAVPRNTYGALLPESAPRSIQGVAMFLAAQSSSRSLVDGWSVGWSVCRSGGFCEKSDLQSIKLLLNQTGQAQLITDPSPSSSTTL